MSSYLEHNQNEESHPWAEWSLSQTEETTSCLPEGILIETAPCRSLSSETFIPQNADYVVCCSLKNNVAWAEAVTQ